MRFQRAFIALVGIGGLGVLSGCSENEAATAPVVRPVLSVVVEPQRAETVSFT
ncbi:MAG: efflux transporter periplasmic adaptor subunit, partial [Starkeya sp.]|nr:efflux transporter periplasmic adaptor subunit [Starkeya sp.]